VFVSQKGGSKAKGGIFFCLFLSNEPGTVQVTNSCHSGDKIHRQVIRKDDGTLEKNFMKKTH
jgi:hypothetical protein